MAIYVSTVLDEQIFSNVDYFNKESLIEIDVNEHNEQTVTLDKNNIQNHFGITIHALYDFDYDKEIIVNIELLFTDNIIGNLKYFDGKKYIIDNNQIIENNTLKANIHLNCWNKKCRFFIDNLNVNTFIIKKFTIKDLNNNVLFTQKLWSPKIKNHYSLIKGRFLYDELTKILYKTDVFMILNNKYKINYNLPDIKYYHLNNINKKTNILYLFIVNYEYYNNLISNKFLKESIENNSIRTIFRSCSIPNDFKYNNGIFFIQNKNMRMPESFINILNANEKTVDSCMEKEKKLNLKKRIYVNTMGVSSNLKYHNNSYNDNKIHILFVGRLTRPFNLIEYINNIDNLLDHKKYIIDILPGSLELNGKKLNPANIKDFKILKLLINKTINLLPSVPQNEVFQYILKSDIGIDFPTDINNLSIKGAENSKLYEYISGGLPTVSQLTPNSYFINKYNCGIELNKISTPKDYYNAIIELSSKINNYNRHNISSSFISHYSYKNLTNILVRHIMSFYKEIPKELLGNWNYPNDKITLDTPYLKNHKFLIRDRTINSNWNRLLRYFPDLFTDDKKSFLDLSCGNGATLEILRFLGHTGFGVDYESKNHCFDKPLFNSTLEMNNKWPYKILLKSQNLDFKGHDLNVLPYPFEDNSFDIVNSWGAIEFYGRPKYWKVFLLEMLRISKEYVNITFNDISPWLKDNQEYIQEYNTFFNEIENNFSNFNVKIEKISERHYKLIKKGKINISYLDSSNFKVDEFISIGGECSVSEALKHLSIRNFSSPFDWIITDFNKIYNTFQSNFSIQNFLNIDDIKHINKFKGKFTTSDNVFYYHEQDCNLIDDVLIKYTRRLNRLKDILSCNKSIILIRKSKNDTLEEIIKLEKLIIKMYPNINFKILFINPNVKTMHYSNHIIGVYLDEFYFIRWSNGTWNHEHQTNDLNEIMCNCLKDVFFKLNIDKSDPFLKDINTIYNTNYVSCKYNEKEHFITIKNANKLPSNSGICFSFHKNIKNVTLTFQAKKITKKECYLKVYTGKTWIKLDEQLDSEYKKFSIVSEFDFNAKSKWRIGFKINTNENVDFELCLRDIKFK
jgi:SAM-dependent methyltransferase